MAILETIATGISLMDIGKTMHGWVSGQTVAAKLDQISAQLKRLDDHRSEERRVGKDCRL